MKLLCNISVNSKHKGIIGNDVIIISKRFNCGFENLTYIPKFHDNNEVHRANMIKELTTCLEGGGSMENFIYEDIKDVRDCIACY